MNNKSGQGREIQATLRAPDAEQLDMMLLEMGDYTSEVGLEPVEVLSKGPDIDGGYVAHILGHNFNPLAWVRKRYGELEKEGVSATIRGLTKAEYEEERRRDVTKKEAKRKKELVAYTKKTASDIADRKLEFEEEKAISDIELGKRKAKAAIEAEKARRRGFVSTTIRGLPGMVGREVKTRVVSGAESLAAAQRARVSEETKVRKALEAQSLAEAKVSERARVKLAKFAVTERAKVARKAEKETRRLKEKVAKRLITTGGVIAKGPGVGERQVFLGAPALRPTTPRVYRPMEIDLGFGREHVKVLPPTTRLPRDPSYEVTDKGAEVAEEGGDKILQMILQAGPMTSASLLEHSPGKSPETIRRKLISLYREGLIQDAGRKPRVEATTHLLGQEL